MNTLSSWIDGLKGIVDFASGRSNAPQDSLAGQMERKIRSACQSSLMTVKQKIVLVAGIVLVGLAFLFPPST